MPTWKISSYRFYFHSGEPLKKHKPAHIHVRGLPHGKIQFWLEKTDAKSKNEVKVKKIKGRVSEEEQNEVKKLVVKNKDLFLAKWKKYQAQAGK
ncbi:conserved protein of unknown function (DUF4160 domain) [endosymbiont DhMRE of Dentiscutata heterogama]|uniref:DUF4160 domain-containing protein n=1 Tax=endosymbiont DhMRE of Dentiscutata heterogama TaxID=1609546 RepID=UPI000629D43D|nr:DUF4160 domain-containing protein [endosymbiont DhMRE of Dentiscutata heterogama]CFW92962.1 conserved protein of unknown function (DUF4160 domain) [endosymbiont DhMRE of Dentiscutata heterogama]